MNNAELILRTLDEHLDHPVRLVLYGRAALQLGFANPPSDVSQSKDIDGIIPMAELDALIADDNFWNAQEATNAKLRPQGLYITHHAPPISASPSPPTAPSQAIPIPINPRSA